MFEINSNLRIKSSKIDGSKFYIIDNFYLNPEIVLNFFLSTESIVHKKEDKPSFNQVFFEDRRHILHSNQMYPIYNYLGKICHENYKCNNDLIITNFTRFYSNDFNDYKNNYWWPHKDEGYTGILYLNPNDNTNGTNLYKVLNLEEEPPNCPEHFRPWRKKKNFKLIKSIKPKFNRMFLFDAKYFTHGMNICNDRYFGDEYRINQAFFL